MSWWSWTICAWRRWRPRLESLYQETWPTLVFFKIQITCLHFVIASLLLYVGTGVVSFISLDFHVLFNFWSSMKLTSYDHKISGSGGTMKETQFYPWHHSILTHPTSWDRTSSWVYPKIKERNRDTEREREYLLDCVEIIIPKHLTAHAGNLADLWLKGPQSPPPYTHHRNYFAERHISLSLPLSLLYFLEWEIQWKNCRKWGNPASFFNVKILSRGELLHRVRKARNYIQNSLVMSYQIIWANILRANVNGYTVLFEPHHLLPLKFFGLVWFEPHMVMLGVTPGSALRKYSWQCPRPYEILEIKPELTALKSNVIPIILHSSFCLLFGHK